MAIDERIAKFPRRIRRLLMCAPVDYIRQTGWLEKNNCEITFFNIELWCDANNNDVGVIPPYITDDGQWGPNPHHQSCSDEIKKLLNAIDASVGLPPGYRSLTPPRRNRHRRETWAKNKSSVVAQMLRRCLTHDPTLIDIDQQCTDAALIRIGFNIRVRHWWQNPRWEDAQKIIINPRWRTDDVMGLTRAIYDNKVFDRMPILGDALMDAGADGKIIKHCQEGGAGYRGDLLLDLLLGKR